MVFHMFLNKIDVLDRKFVSMFVTVISIPISHEHRYTALCVTKYKPKPDPPQCNTSGL